jgi:DNA-binding NarL/FixJ family response regulator
MIKVLIADDHAVVRRGLKQILEDSGDIAVLGEASNAAEIMEKLYENEWDILILDITMPGKNGLDALIDIKQKKPDLKILVLSIHPEEEIAIRAFKSGASGYLNKDSVPLELIKSVKKVSEGGKYISTSFAESILLSMDKDQMKPLHDSLSDREFQVLCLIASGNTLSQIANELSLSVKTISTYRSRILEKIGLKTNVELTHYAIKNKLVISI